MEKDNDYKAEIVERELPNLDIWPKKQKLY